MEDWKVYTLALGYGGCGGIDQSSLRLTVLSFFFTWDRSTLPSPRGGH